MKTEFEKLEISIAASRDEIWHTITEFESYFNWNTLVPFGRGTLKEGNSLLISLKLKDRSKIGRCMVNKVVPGHYFILSRKILFKWLLYMEHAFIIENVNQSCVFSQTLKVSGVLKPFMINKIKHIWLRFHEVNEDLKNYLT